LRGLAYNSGHGSTVNAYRNPDQERTLPAMASRIIPEYPESGQPPKIITCTNGMEVLVDAEDYPLLSRHNWYINWSKHRPYAITKLKTDQSTIWRCIFMHHLILGTAVETDHKDQNPLNNQKHNLRPSTRQQNGWNKGKPRAGRFGEASSQFKGVCKRVNAAGETVYYVLIKLSKKGEVPARHFRAGPFKDEVKAALVYNAEIVKHRGEFAWVNPITETKGEKP
jgi:hypothetical protein